MFPKNLPVGTEEKKYKCPENILFIKKQIIFATQNEKMKNLYCKEGFKPNYKIEDLAFLDQYISRQIITKESLNELNTTIILETAAQLLLEPFGGTEYFDGKGLSDCSMRGDTWHPEDLFMNKKSNMNKQYWEKLEVSFDPLGTGGVGQKYLTDAKYFGLRQSNVPFNRDFKRQQELGDGLRQGGEKVNLRPFLTPPSRF